MKKTILGRVITLKEYMITDSITINERDYRISR